MTTAILPACRCSHTRAAHADPTLRPQCTARGCTCLRYWPTGVAALASTNAGTPPRPPEAAAPTTKTCTGCDETKAIGEFYLRYADGRSTERIPKCRDCNNTRARVATPARVLRTRARHRATAELIERHRVEFAALLEEATEEVTAEAERLAAAAAEQPADDHEHEQAALPRLKPGPRRRGQDVTERLDIARCPECVGYHDRGHRCATCGAEPCAEAS